ncbi:hypothetical protein Ocin01_16811 [Orchesella cincta]|uniref:F-box domain-containing protein n=1 Tax=Orchesella cincta TaxID=48709 RepID=A0A1D2MA71_ORCCI|nr:hypothetical protein Ocin01_16811 [Orchesella cincta]
MASPKEDNLQTPLPTSESCVGDEEGLQHLEALPEVVWCSIADNLRSEDLVSCMGVSSTLRRKIRKIRPCVILPPKVFQVTLKYLSKDEVLNCRLICGTWKKAVDHVIQHLPSENSVGSSKLYMEQELELVSKLTRFTEEMGNHNGNPFPGRTISLFNKFTLFHDRSEYWQEASRFIQRFGHHVWHLDIAFDLNFTDESMKTFFERNLPNIRNIFLHLPNLKTLIMNYYDGMLQCQNMTDFVNCVMNYTNDYMSGVLEENPLPRLEFLQKLTVGNQVFPSFVKGIIKSCNREHLKLLTIAAHWLDQDYDFVNLEHFTFEVSELEDFERLDKIKCPTVKTVEIRLRSHQTYQLVELLEAINPFFAKTLKCLYIFGDEVECDGWVDVDGEDGEVAEFEEMECESQPEEQNFPDLQFLDIVYHGSLSNLPVLPSLKRLRIRNWNGDQGRKQIRTELKTEDHEIWKLMQKLQTIQHEGQLFYRP